MRQWHGTAKHREEHLWYQLYILNFTFMLLSGTQDLIFKAMLHSAMSCETCIAMTQSVSNIAAKFVYTRRGCYTRQPCMQLVSQCLLYCTVVYVHTCSGLLCDKLQNGVLHCATFKKLLQPLQKGELESTFCIVFCHFSCICFVCYKVCYSVQCIMAQLIMQ